MRCVTCPGHFSNFHVQIFGIFTLHTPRALPIHFFFVFFFPVIGMPTVMFVLLFQLRPTDNVALIFIKKTCAAMNDFIQFSIPFFRYCIFLIDRDQPWISWLPYIYCSVRWRLAENAEWSIVCCGGQIPKLQGDPELYAKLIFRIEEPTLGQMSSNLAHVNLRGQVLRILPEL